MSRPALHARIAALAEMSAAELLQAWARISTGAPPPLSPDLLRRELAFRIQEKALGGLPVAVARELVRAAGGDVAARPSAPALRPGAQLIREWQGRTVSVMVEEDGALLWEGERHASLSSIAKAVTGAHWSGPRFFGLVARG